MFCFGLVFWVPRALYFVDGLMCLASCTKGIYDRPKPFLLFERARAQAELRPRRHAVPRRRPAHLVTGAGGVGKMERCEWVESDGANAGGVS